MGIEVCATGAAAGDASFLMSRAVRLTSGRSPADAPGLGHAADSTHGLRSGAASETPANLHAPLHLS